MTPDPKRDLCTLCANRNRRITVRGKRVRCGCGEACPGFVPDHTPRGGRA